MCVCVCVCDVTGGLIGDHVTRDVLAKYDEIRSVAFHARSPQ